MSEHTAERDVFLLRFLLSNIKNNVIRNVRHVSRRKCSMRNELKTVLPAPGIADIQSRRSIETGVLLAQAWNCGVSTIQRQVPS